MLKKNVASEFIGFNFGFKNMGFNIVLADDSRTVTARSFKKNSEDYIRLNNDFHESRKNRRVELEW